MIKNLYMHVNGGILAGMPPVDRPWKDNLRSQIFCQNQEEYDYLSSLNLMHGREIEIHIWDEWRSMRRGLLSGGTRLRVLPIAYTTWYVNLRGF